MEPGNGMALGEIRHATNMIPMNTWKRTPLAKLEKHKINNSTDPSITGQQILQDKTHTWTHPPGMIARQIYYSMISNKYRNAVRKAWAEQGWRGNIEQQRQHDVIRMDITMNLTKGYRKKHITESGTDIRYDI